MQKDLRPTQKRKALREVKERVLTLPVPQHGNSDKSGEILEPPEGSDLAADAAKMTAALMPSEKDDARDALLFKSADQLTEAEALELGRWYHGLQSSDPLRGELNKMRRDFYTLNYGDDPAEMDETGRMKPTQPLRRMPDKPVPAKAADGYPLADGIRRIAGALASRAGRDGFAQTAKVLQMGLNLAGQALKVAAETLQTSLNGLNEETAAKRQTPKLEPLKIDGDVGPKTEDAFRSALADHGADMVTKRYSDALGFGFG